MFTIITLSSCTKEYTCECVTVIGGLTTESIIESKTKADARAICEENEELLGITIAECEII